MKRYAFIDVSNTNGTTKGCLSFSINWSSLYSFLKNEKWNCTDAFFYKGYRGEKEKNQLQKLEDGVGYKIRTKLTHIHPNQENDLLIKCNSCGVEFPYKQTIKGNKKSNCDVELTTDALNTLSAGDEALFFTGDGDFAYLVEDLINKGITIILISSYRKDQNGNKRFSTRLKEILKREEKLDKRVRFIHIDSWKKEILKEDFSTSTESGQKENRHEA